MRITWVQWLLFLTTVFTTTLAGGPQFSISIMAILLAHEFGHYFAARHHGVEATLPYFIPSPLFLGTMGAFIKMTSPTPNRKALFDIAVAGPIAGLCVALPITVIGIARSHYTLVTKQVIDIVQPPFFQWVATLFHGPAPTNAILTLDPLALAGWAGLFLTALNMLPIGQLDGGHASYAFNHEFSLYLSICMLLWLVFSTSYIMIAVLLLLMGIGHRPTEDDTIELDGKRKWIGCLLWGFSLFCFVPNIITVVKPM